MIIYKKDIETLKANLVNLPRLWDGKTCVLELKEADYNWRQMEWWAFYFEYKVKNLLDDKFAFPGDKYDNVSFDLKGTINWDLKASAIKTNNQKIILNDKEAMELSVQQNKYHGEIIALCDVDYNDVDRNFQKWHSELKGGVSKYEQERKQRTSNSRYRKTKAELWKIILLLINKDTIDILDIHKQGRNSNGLPRQPKYMLDIETINDFKHYEIIFEK
jgi:hypothetical protein